jgi:hypothetical protein
MADPGFLHARHGAVLEQANRLISELGEQQQVAASDKVRRDAALGLGERNALGDTELILALSRIVADQDVRLKALEESVAKSNTTKKAKASGVDKTPANR